MATVTITVTKPTATTTIISSNPAADPAAKPTLDPATKIPYIICTTLGTPEDHFPRLLEFLGLEQDFECFHHAVDSNDGQLYKMELTLAAADHVAALSWCLFIRPMFGKNIVNRMRPAPVVVAAKELEEDEIRR